jgi:hypothetical protein
MDLGENVRASWHAWIGVNEMSPDGTARVKAVADPGDLQRNENGPEHTAPVNERFSSSFDEFAGEFARETAVLLGDRSPSDYEQDREALELGHRMADDPRFAGRDWATVEKDLEAEWQKRGHGDWGRAQPTVQQGWMEARGMG